MRMGVYVPSPTPLCLPRSAVGGTRHPSVLRSPPRAHSSLSSVKNHSQHRPYRGKKPSMYPNAPLSFFAAMPE